MNLFFRLTETNFPMRDQSQTLIEVKPCHARKLKISTESRQRGLSRICLPFITAFIAFSLGRVRPISALHRWAFRLILVCAIEVSRWTPSGLHGLCIITHEMQRF